MKKFIIMMMIVLVAFMAGFYVPRVSNPIKQIKQVDISIYTSENFGNSEYLKIRTANNEVNIPLSTLKELEDVSFNNTSPPKHIIFYHWTMKRLQDWSVDNLIKCEWCKKVFAKYQSAKEYNDGWYCNKCAKDRTTYLKKKLESLK